MITTIKVRQDDGSEVIHVRVNEFKYTCWVCEKPNNYWWMYCKDHENQCDREMEPEQWQP